MVSQWVLAFFATHPCDEAFDVMSEASFRSFRFFELPT